MPAESCFLHFYITKALSSKVKVKFCLFKRLKMKSAYRLN